MSEAARGSAAFRRTHGTLVLLNSDGSVLAGQHGVVDDCGRRILPFGLQQIVDAVVSDARYVLSGGQVDIIIEFPLTVRLFSLKYRSRAALALYIERQHFRQDRIR